MCSQQEHNHLLEHRGVPPKVACYFLKMSHVYFHQLHTTSHMRKYDVPTREPRVAQLSCRGAVDSPGYHVLGFPVNNIGDILLHWPLMTSAKYDHQGWHRFVERHPAETRHQMFATCMNELPVSKYGNSRRSMIRILLHIPGCPRLLIIKSMRDLQARLQNDVEAPWTDAGQ